MVGALVGFLVAVVLIARFAVGVQWKAAAGAVVVTLIVFVGLVLTAPDRGSAAEPDPDPVVKEEPFRPFFRVGVRVSHTREILESVAEDEQPIPFTEVKIRSGGFEFVRTGWGPEFLQCNATLSRDDLAGLLPLLRSAAEVAGEFCRTPEDDLSIAANWSLDGESGNQSLQAGCLEDLPEMAALISELDAMGDRLCPAVTATP